MSVSPVKLYIVVAKRLLWDSCKHDLETSGLPFQAQWDSNKRRSHFLNNYQYWHL